MQPHRVVAINHAEESENRIHSDDIARAYGFTGALVPGVAVFGYMTRPLTDRLGLAWLGHSRIAVRLLKPAYHGDVLSIPVTPTGADGYLVECRNANDVLLAQLTVDVSDALPPVDSRAALPGSTRKAPRVEIAWDAIDVDVPFAAVAWTPTDAENRRYAERQRRPALIPQ